MPCIYTYPPRLCMYVQCFVIQVRLYKTCCFNIECFGRSTLDNNSVLFKYSGSQFKQSQFLMCWRSICMASPHIHDIVLHFLSLGCYLFRCLSYQVLYSQLFRAVKNNEIPGSCSVGTINILYIENLISCGLYLSVNLNVFKDIYLF